MSIELSKVQTDSDTAGISMDAPTSDSFMHATLANHGALGHCGTLRISPMVTACPPFAATLALVHVEIDQMLAPPSPFHAPLHPHSLQDMEFRSTCNHMASPTTPTPMRLQTRRRTTLMQPLKTRYPQSKPEAISSFSTRCTRWMIRLVPLRLFPPLNDGNAIRLNTDYE